MNSTAERLALSHKLLVIDIGNTTTAIGLFKEKLLIDSWKLATKVVRTTDELWIILGQLLQNKGERLDAINAVAISSVVPDLTFIYSNLARDRLRITPVVITSSNVPGLRVVYDPPESVGADRLCGAVAGFEKYGGPLILLDMGTATVFDVISADGDYLGGLIAPGLLTAVDSLHHAAAQLPKVDLEFPESVIGSSTKTSIQSGVLYGAIEMIDGLVERIQSELPVRAKVVATGGFAKLLKSHSRSIEYLEPNLVLEGIRIIAERQ
jgi:type III pantothenate kinase